MPKIGVASIATANDMDHARHRKLLAHAFSEKALRDQEPILQYYTDLLISKFSERSASRHPVDLPECYNFISFDIIADLSFGEPFHNLEEQENHPWVKAVEADMQMAVQLSRSYAIPSLSTNVNLLLPLHLGGKHHLNIIYPTSARRSGPRHAILRSPSLSHRSSDRNKTYSTEQDPLYRPVPSKGTHCSCLYWNSGTVPNKCSIFSAENEVEVEITSLAPNSMM